MGNTAVLSSYDNYTTFTFGDITLTFRTCSGLERYTKILTWDAGYIEVMAKYSHKEQEVEEYIDLCPVLDDLHMDREQFLDPIKEVRIEYGELEVGVASHSKVGTCLRKEGKEA